MHRREVATETGSGFSAQLWNGERMERGKRILYIEDEADLQWLVKHILDSLGGFDVLVCGSGAEGLRRIRDFAPDLVLLDVMMPQMDGFEVLRNLRADSDTASIPVVFLSARSGQADEYRGMGALGVIAKPFEPYALVEQVREYAGEPVAA